jgi:nucleoside-diphosphate kinase
MGKIFDAIAANNMQINKLKMSKFNKSTVSQFYKEHEGRPFFDGLTAHMCSDVVVGMELVAPDAVNLWRSSIGPTSSEQARSEAPYSVRGMCGTDNTKNAVHGADSAGACKRETQFWFGGEDPSRRLLQTTAVLNNCTLCLIKPHILKEGKLGAVIDMILSAGFEISAMELFNLTRPVVEEFYDVYKGVLPEYLPLIEHLSNGPTIALEVRQSDAVSAFRDLCGPHDPEIAKHLRPETIR